MTARLSASTRRFLDVGLILLAGLLAGIGHAQNAQNGARPVGIQELSLLLRSGYTGDEMLRETAGRPLLTPLDAAAERALLDAGADRRTIDTLKTTRPVVSDAEAAEAQRRQAEAEQHRLDAWAVTQEHQLEINRQTVQAQLAARRQTALKQVATTLRDRLVVYRDSRLQPYDNADLANKTIFLLYSASATNGACRKLTPQLVKFYQEFAPKHPDFELVYISGDRSAYDMENAMRQDAVPWAALAWERKAEQPDLVALAKDGIPRLVLIDGTGRLLADNLENGKHVGEQRVLEALVARTNPASAAR